MTNQMLLTSPVRIATLDDLDQLSVLFNQYRIFYQQPDDLALARDFLWDRLQNRESVIFVSKTDAHLAGFAQLYPTFSSVSAKRAWILNDLFVALDARKQGIASALLAQVLQHAHESGAAWVNLETTPDNVAAQALYRKFGFQLEQYYLTFSHALA